MRILNSAWRKLWPESVPDRDFECLNPEPVDPTVQLVNEIVSLGQILDLEMDGVDMEELVQEHNEELTTEELLELHKEQQQKVVEELSSGEEEIREDSLSSSEIKEVLIMWEKMQNFVEKHHPNKAVSGRCMNLFNDNAMSHFRQKQVSLDKFLVKLSKRQSSDPEPQPDPSGVKFPGRESPESEGDSLYPTVIPLLLPTSQSSPSSQPRLIIKVKYCILFIIVICSKSYFNSA